MRLCPQIKVLYEYGIKSMAAISLPFNLHCEPIAALFSITIPYGLFADVQTCNYVKKNSLSLNISTLRCKHLEIKIPLLLYK